MIEIRIDEKSVESLLKLSKIIDLKDQNKAISRGFKDAAILVERNLRENISGRLLHVRSSHLRDSIGTTIDSSDNGLIATIGSGQHQGERVRYADIHETGGTIRPRISQWLTIPLPAAKTSSGVTRFTAREVKEGREKYSGSFIHRGIIFGVTKSGQTLLKSGRYRRGGIVPLFVLKRSVDIPASRYLSITKEESINKANELMLQSVKEDLNKGSGQ